MWRTNVTRHKTNVCKKLLEEKLFLLHPILGKALLKQRLSAQEMEKLRFFDMNSQSLGLMEPPSLETFREF